MRFSLGVIMSVIGVPKMIPTQLKLYVVSEYRNTQTHKHTHHTCICTHTYTPTHIHTHYISTHTHINTHAINIHKFIHTTHKHTNVYTYSQTHTHTELSGSCCRPLTQLRAQVFMAVMGFQG